MRESNLMNAPTFELKVNDKSVSAGVRSLVQSVEFETIDGMADMAKIIIADPRSIDGSKVRLISDSQLFAPGNEVTLAYGYHGNVIENVGRTVIRKANPNFPQDGQPTIEIIGYDASCWMMDNSPEPLQERKETRAKGGGTRVELKDSRAGRRFKMAKYSEAVEARAKDYGFLTDVDETPDPGQDFNQKAGMTDYDFVKGLANMTGYYFWVDYDFDALGWTLHFKNPETYVEPQDKEYNFKYGHGDYSTLFSFEPQMAITGSTTKLKVLTKDPQTGSTIEVTMTEENDKAPEVIDTSDGNGTERLDSEYTTASDVKLFLNDYSFEIRTDRKFYSEAELASWAQQWFRRNREHFIMGEGTIIGLETLRARQIHKFSGIGIAYSGLYAFNRVRHVFDATNGYHVEFSVRKVVGSLPQLPTVNRIPPGGE